MANTFTKLIQCSCGHRYRHITERGKRKLLCQGYSKKKSNCTRNILEEEVLLDLIRVYCNRNKIELVEDNKFMKSIIEIINIDEDHNIIIKYKNGEKGIFNNNSVHI